MKLPDPHYNKIGLANPGVLLHMLGFLCASGLLEARMLFFKV